MSSPWLILTIAMGIGISSAGPLPRYLNTTSHDTISPVSRRPLLSSSGPTALSSSTPYPSSVTIQHLSANSEGAASSTTLRQETPGQNRVFATGVRNPSNHGTETNGSGTPNVSGEHTKGTTTLTLYTTVLPNKHVSTSGPAAGSSSQAASYGLSSSASSEVQPSGSVASSDSPEPSKTDRTKAASSAKSSPVASLSSSSNVYPLPDSATRERHSKGPSITVDPVQPSGTNAFPSYSYAPTTSKRRRPHTPPYQPGGLPTIITQQPSEASPYDVASSTKPSSDFPSASSSSSAIAGITIVPIDPDSNATTVYITITTTTTDAGVTETATVTAYA